MLHRRNERLDLPLHLRIARGLLAEAVQFGDTLLNELLPIDRRRRLRRRGASAAAGVVADIDVVPDCPVPRATTGRELSDRPIRPRPALPATPAGPALSIRRSLTSAALRALRALSAARTLRALRSWRTR
jgi:hypothetical protein